MIPESALLYEKRERKTYFGLGYVHWQIDIYCSSQLLLSCLVSKIKNIQGVQNY